MLESIEEIRTYLRVFDEGSFSAAARSMSVSVNAVSKRFAQIEGRLGIRLAERSTRRVAFNEEGVRFADRCRAILAEVDEAEEDLRPHGGKLTGVVRVAAHPSLITDVLLRGLSHLHRENPNLSVQLFARSVAVDPVTEGLDLVACTGDVPFQSAAVRALGELRWALAASQDYARARGLPQKPEQLTGHECLRALRHRRETHWLLRSLRGQECTVRVTGSFESDDTESLRLAIYSGLGIGFRPAGEVRREGEKGTLVPVLPGWIAGGSGVRLQLLSPVGRTRLGRVRAVAELIEQAARASA